MALSIPRTRQFIRRLDFFNIMAKKIIFVTDFDGTLTRFDTTDISFKACRKYLDGSLQKRAELEEVHKERGSVYLNGYSKCFNEGINQFGSGVSSSSSQKSLVDFVVSLDAYNRDSRVMIANKHLLDDIIEDKNILRKFCKDVGYQEQSLETLRWLQEESSFTVLTADDKVASCLKVLSVNWFKPVLVECLEGIVNSENIVSALPPILAKDGSLDLGPASSSIDKLNWIKKWKINFGGDECLSVYVGDSMTDLLALLEADVGILVGKNRHVLEAVKVFGLDFVAITKADGDEHLEINNQNNNRLYYADSWNEIHLFLKKILK